MADMQIGGASQVSASIDPSIDVGELTILIRPYGNAYCEYIGTRMQIEAEGVIPAGTEWPDGFDRIFWEANGVLFWLRRERPEGAKGPRRDFLFCDHWCLRMQEDNWNGYSEAAKQKTKELKDLLYSKTPECRAADAEHYRRYYAARDDARFQEFKALFPAIELAKGKRRGRPPIVKENRHA